jgi:hypothetical protein
MQQLQEYEADRDGFLLNGSGFQVETNGNILLRLTGRLEEEAMYYEYLSSNYLN